MCQCKFGLRKNCYVFVRASPGRRIGLVTQGRKGCLPMAIDHADLTDGEGQDARQRAQQHARHQS